MKINNTHRTHRKRYLDVINEFPHQPPVNSTLVCRASKLEDGDTLWRDLVAEPKGYEKKLHPQLLPLVRSGSDSQCRVRGIFNANLTEPEIERFEKAYNARIDRLTPNVHAVHGLSLEGLKHFAQHERVTYISGAPYSEAVWGEDPGPLGLYGAIESVFTTSKTELRELGELSRGYRTALKSSRLTDAKSLSAKDFRVLLIRETAIATAKRVKPGLSRREFEKQAKDNPWHRDLVNLLELTEDYLRKMSEW